MFRSAVALIILCFALPVLADDAGVQLLAPKTLQPTSTFEVRFATPMVAPDKLGNPVESPIVFQPEVKGQFVWLSSRSGSFLPAGALPLGAKFTVSLRPDLKDVAGKPVTAVLNETVQTPPMRLKGAPIGGRATPDDATAQPSVKLLFNTNVDAAAAAKFIHWQDANGRKLDAKVEQADPSTNREHRFSTYNSDDRSLATWSEVAAGKLLREEPEYVDEDDLEAAARPKPKEEPRHNLLLVTPVGALPPGPEWKLVLEAGLPSAEWNIGLPEEKVVNLGTVQPFAIRSLEAESNRYAGRRLVVRFSKSLGEEVTKETALKWIEVTPEAKNLTADVESDTVTIKGDFALERPYQVTINKGFPAEEPFKIEEPISKSVTFVKIAPRLYFQDFATHQLLNGTRQFRLLSVNVPHIRITALLVQGAGVPPAVAAYDHYQDRADNALDNEFYSRVAVEKIGGKSIWQKEFTTKAKSEDPNDSQETIALNWDEIVGPHKTGTVILTAESIEPNLSGNLRVGAQALVQLTDLGAIWKRDSSGMLWHAFSLADGKSLAGIKLRLLGVDQKQIAQATTDASGNAHLPLRDEEPRPRWVLATKGEDSHLVAIYNEDAGVPLYRLGVPEGGSDDYSPEPSSQNTVFLMTERGVYKPGDTIHLKGYARIETDKGSRTAAGKRLTVTANDARDREFFRKETKLNEFGSFTEDIVLPEGTLGKFRIDTAAVAEEDELSGSCTVQVQDYRPNAFEITIPAPPENSGPASLEFPVTAKYLMGKPLTKAKLTWSLVGRDKPFKPEELDDYAFCGAIENFRLERALERTSQLNAQGQADLDPSGQAKVSTDFLLNPKAPQPRGAKFLCEITDLNQQTVSKSVDFVRQSSDFYFGLRRFDSVLKEGEAVPVDLIAVSNKGKALTQPVTAKLRLTRIDWQTNRLEGAGNTAEFESKPQLSVQWEKEVTTQPGQGPNRKPIPVTLDELKAGKAGEYLLEALGKDSGGHDVLTSLSFEVAGTGETTWDYRNSYAIEVSSDKESYEPGQTATLLVKTPIAGEALVTVEHNRVVRSFMTKLTGNAPSVRVAIGDGDAPNVFVSVMVLRGADASPRKIKAPEYRIGYCQLKVLRPREKLNVQVKSSAAAVKPGDMVTLEADVRDFSGKPAAGSEVALYAVDEGVLSLTGYKTPDALTFFNHLRLLGVQTSLTIPTLLREDATESDFANKGYLVGDGKGGPPTIDGLRTKFIACAYWNGSLRADANGHVRAQFTAPDSLTRYRVIAVATSKSSQFGAGEAAFEINKPIALEPALPRFGNVGDKITLRAVVHNSTDLNGEADIELTLDGVAKAAELKKRVAISPHADTAVDFPIEFAATGKGKWRWQASFKAATGQTEFHDSVQTELNVGYPVPLAREVTTKRVEKDQDEIGRLVDPKIMEGTGEARIALANSRTLELHEALRQLLIYPYGCVEQTTSSLLPWLTARDLKTVFPELDKPEPEVRKAVNHGIDLLLSMQTSDGGLSYWPRGRKSTLWGSAYGAIGFVMAGKAGFKVPDDNANQLFNYLSKELRGTADDSDSNYKLSSRCLAVYALALAGKAEPAYHEVLFKERQRLSAEDRALLALAVIESKGPASMVDELLRQPIDEEAYVETWFGSVTREYALNLLAWTKYQSHDPKVDELAAELFQRRMNGHWGTTQGNAWSLLALSSYLRAVESGDPNSRGEVRWGDAMKPFALSKASPRASASFPIAASRVSSPITLKKTGGTVFSEATVEARPQLVAQPKQDRGYSITRHYARVGDDGKLTPATNLHVGDRVLVTLDCEVRRRATYVAIEDPLPGVFEPLNPAFKSQETLAGESLGLDWTIDYQEMREDRVCFFADLLYPGHRTLRYLARVVAAGEALSPSAKIEEMYHPERYGLTETQTVKTETLP